MTVHLPSPSPHVAPKVARTITRSPVAFGTSPGPTDGVEYTSPIQVDGTSTISAVAFAKNLAAVLEKEGVALDAASYRSAPPGLRIWCGATVEQSDLQALTPWLDWAFATCVAQLQKAG